MKKLFILSAAVLALAACSNEDFINGNEGEKIEKGEMISFGSFTKGTSRADHTGADAAALLGKNFVVEGTKGENSVATGVVFDNYNVNWTENTAETTQSNTSDWEYVGVTKHENSKIDATVGQTIKYWDYSQAQYDFIAYSSGGVAIATDAEGVTAYVQGTNVYVTPINPATAKTSAYKVKGAAEQLGKFYIADLVTVKNAEFGKEVKLSFRNLGSKVRLAFYETVPGYSIRDLEFYDVATGTTPSTNATLFSSDATIYSAGVYNVYYPTLNDDDPATDKNKAHVGFSPLTGGSSTKAAFTTLDYTRAQTSTKESGKKYLGESSSTATKTKTDDNGYTKVLANEGQAKALTLRCNYTLVSNDGSGEEIKVWGATAVVPAEFCQWKPNYAYTYIFKISDATNGATEKLGGTVTGLLPVTFDAVVADSQDGIQETITTVATPSITTYGYKSGAVVKSTENNEYPTGTDIYVMAQDGATVLALNEKGALYTATTTNAIETVITEAEVMDALNMGTVASGVVTGRNKIVLTPAASGAVTFPEAIPGADGNDITVTENNVAKFTGASTATTYAYVYKVSDGTPTTYNTAVVLNTAPTDWATTYTQYYTDFACTAPAPETFVAGTYYQKLKNNNNVYAVKIIKVN